MSEEKAVDVDGSAPPFRCPDRARRSCVIHICAAFPGRVAPVPLIPSGTARNDTMTGKMGCISVPDIHKERLETSGSRRWSGCEDDTPIAARTVAIIDKVERLSARICGTAH